MKDILIVILVVMFGSVNAQETNARFLNKQTAHSPFSTNTPAISKSNSQVRYQLDSLSVKYYTGDGQARFINKYNDLGQNIALYEQSLYSESDGWIVHKTKYTYDSLGQVIVEEVFRSDDPIDTVWVASEKSYYYYAGMNLLDSTHVYRFNTAIYELDTKTRHYKNQDLNDTLILLYQNELSGFELTEKQQILYYPDSSLIVENEFYNSAFVPGEVVWELNSKNEIQRDEALNTMTITSYSSFGATTIQQEYKTTYELTNNGSISYEEDYEWDEDATQWILNYKSFYYYDNLPVGELADLGQVNSDEFFTVPINNPDKLNRMEIYAPDSLNNWALFIEANFVYRDLQTNISERHVTNFTIAPNPAKGSVKIAGDNLAGKTLNIYSILGELVYQQMMENQQLVPLNDFTKGVYLIQIGNLTQKLIVD
jgi:hypothetical protein